MSTTCPTCHGSGSVAGPTAVAAPVLTFGAVCAGCHAWVPGGTLHACPPQFGTVAPIRLTSAAPIRMTTAARTAAPIHLTIDGPLISIPQD